MNRTCLITYPTSYIPLCNNPLVDLLPGDDDSPTLKRKNDILSRAQEFADLKKQCEEALPYNAHKATLLSDR